MKVTNSFIKTVFKVSVAITLIFFLARMIDWRESWKIARSLDSLYLFLYMAFLILGIAISAKKWEILGKFCGYTFPFSSYFRWYLAGTFVNNFLPSVIGGDTFRAMALGKLHKSRAHAISGIIFDRYIGLVSLAILGIFFSLWNISLVVENPLWLFLFSGAVFGVVAQFLILPGKKWSLFPLIFRFLPKKITKIAESIEEFKDTRLTTISFLLGILFSFIGVGVANYILFTAVGISFSFIDFLSIIFFINIISAFPLSINNIGVKEWAYYIFFGYFGIAPEISVTVAIISRFLQMGLSLWAIPTVLTFRRERKKDEAEEENDEKENTDER
ncbi:MAG: flippase-like domain-containing protein [Candidatus Moraniibacteriota bacterium]|nr:MAG: flippase-like domain-containing protein [Candidatus Moranbacteria bacterium]